MEGNWEGEIVNGENVRRDKGRIEYPTVGGLSKQKIIMENLNVGTGIGYLEVKQIYRMYCMYLTGHSVLLDWTVLYGTFMQEHRRAYNYHWRHDMEGDIRA